MQVSQLHYFTECIYVLESLILFSAGCKDNTMGRQFLFAYSQHPGDNLDLLIYPATVQSTALTVKVEVPKLATPIDTTISIKGGQVSSKRQFVSQT